MTSTRQHNRYLLVCTGRVALGTSGVLYRAAAMELARYQLDVVVVQGVRWDKGGTV